MRQRAQASVVEELSGPVEVNPEFLAALPPAIQEEVLAQQRMEQQRHAAASANPEDPVDAAAFFQNLQPSLRQAVSIFLNGFILFFDSNVLLLSMKCLSLDSN